jgi:hypothetical protein
MGGTMITDSDRRIEQIYQAGLMHIKKFYHFHLPKCSRPGCDRKISSREDKRGLTLCGICHAAALKEKRIQKHLFTLGPAVKIKPLRPVSVIL